MSWNHWDSLLSWKDPQNVIRLFGLFKHDNVTSGSLKPLVHIDILCSVTPYSEHFWENRDNLENRRQELKSKSFLLFNLLEPRENSAFFLRQNFTTSSSLDLCTTACVTATTNVFRRTHQDRRNRSILTLLYILHGPERTCTDMRQSGPVWRVTMCREEVSLSHRSLMEQCSFFSVQVHPKWTTSIPHMLCMCVRLCAYYITALTLHQLDFKWLTLGVKPSLQSFTVHGYVIYRLSHRCSICD